MARRVLLLLLAGALCGAVGLLGRETELAVPGARDWAARHPDPRAVDVESGRALASQLDGERRNDLALLLAALAAGCVVVAAWPRVERWAGGSSTAVLLCGSVGLGLFHLGVSAAGQVAGLRDGTWSVADGTLDRVAPLQAETLRLWRERIGPDDAVILIGSDPWLYDLVVWALHPRPLYPMLLEIRPTTSTAEVLRGARSLSVGRGHAGRWVIDLDVLRQGRESGHPALIQVE